MTIAQTGKTDNSDMYNQTICHVNWSKIFIPIIWMGLRISTFGAFLMRKQSWTIDAWFWKTWQKKPLPIPFFWEKGYQFCSMCSFTSLILEGKKKSFWQYVEHDPERKKRNLFDNTLNMSPCNRNSWECFPNLTLLLKLTIFTNQFLPYDLF